MFCLLFSPSLSLLPNMKFPANFLFHLNSRLKIFQISLLLIGLLGGRLAEAQYIISGKVTDAQTGDPVPFANVAIKGKVAGTSTNFEGFFTLKTKTIGDSLVVSSMGYRNRSRAIDAKALDQTINFQIDPTSVALQEVKILMGENPAFKIIRGIIANRAIHDRKRLSAYEYDSYAKLELDVDNLSEKLLKRKVFKQIESTIQRLDKLNGEDGKAVIPTFVSESISRFYYRESPQRKREHILKTKVAGVGVNDGGFISQLIGGNTFQNYNFYDNFVPFLGKDFTSPIGDNWKGTYEYFLADSVWVDDYWCYGIEFSPKRIQDLAFTGKMWIDKKTFALVQIDATINKAANINYIEKIKISQELARTPDSAWLPAKTRFLIDIGQLSKNSAGMLAKFYVSNRNFVVNRPKALSFYDLPLEVAEDAKETDPSFWATARHDSLTKDDRLALALVDSVRNLPIVRTYVDIAEIAMTGWKKYDGIEFGPYVYGLAANRVEGLRIRMGFRSNDFFSKKWVVRGFLGYGTRDQVLKYGGELNYIASKRHWAVLGIKHSYDLERVGLTSDMIGDNKIFAAFTRWGYFSNAFLRNQSEVFAKYEPLKGVMLSATLAHTDFDPLFVFRFFSRTEPHITQSKYQDTHVDFEVRLSKNETFIMDGNERYTLGTKRLPVITLKYTRGLMGLKGDFDYHRLQINAFQSLRLGSLGRGSYRLSLGYTPSTVPPPLLFAHLGNETAFYNRNAFNMMNFLEFVSDKYASIQYNHQFDGLLFNRIPGIKRLKWRLVASANVLWGSQRLSNEKLVMKIPRTNRGGFDFDSLEPNKPYVEVGYGIDNLFKIFRIQALHRLTYTDRPDAPKFAVKGSVHFSF